MVCAGLLLLADMLVCIEKKDAKQVYLPAYSKHHAFMNQNHK